MSKLLTLLLISQLIYAQTAIKQLFNVQTIKIKERIDAKEYKNYGYVVAQDNRIVDITPRYSGFIEKLYANRLYQKVKKGERLATLYSPIVYQAKQDYLSAIRYNQKQPANAMVSSAKKKLILLGITKKEIEAIKKSGKVSSYTHIYAPISGWIFAKSINEGSSFNTQKALFQIVNLERVWVEMKLYDKELNHLNLMHHFKIQIAQNPTLVEAKKELLLPKFNQKGTTATLRLSVDNPDEVFQVGRYVTILSSSSKSKKIVIPKNAVIRKNGLWFVFLATPFKGEYEPIAIKIKPLNHTHYEVIKGLNVGDSVVKNALFMMDSDAQMNDAYPLVKD